MAGLDAMKMRVELVMVEASKMSAYVVEHGAVDAQRLRARAGEVEEPANGYTTTFYPSSLLASGATNVTIEAAEERTGVDVRLQLVPLATITGTVTADGPVPPGVQVSVFDAAETMVGLGTRTTRVGPNGQFSFSGLPPGTYTVLARGSAPVEHSVTGQPVGSTSAEKVVIFARGSAGESLWAMTSAAVSGGTVPVSLNLQRGMTVSGSVAFSGPTSAPPDVSKLRVTVAPVGESGKVEGLAVRDVPVTADGQFTIRGVIPGLYRVVPSSGVPPGFLIESAMFGGRDVLDIPLDVKPGEDVAGGVLTFSTQQSELSGALTDPAGKPATDYTLILFAADNRFWLPQSRRIQAARPASDGRFSFRYLPAGDYRLIAVEDVEQGQWFDPGFLKQLLAGAMPLSLAAAEKRTQDIRVSR